MKSNPITRARLQAELARVAQELDALEASLMGRQARKTGSRGPAKQ